MYIGLLIDAQLEEIQKDRRRDGESCKHKWYIYETKCLLYALI